jgi:hypothetical protein
MRLLAPLLMSIAMFGEAPNRLTPQEASAGWRLLFDGSTTSGWLEATGSPFPLTWNIDGSACTLFRIPTASRISGLPRSLAISNCSLSGRSRAAGIQA